MSISRNKKGKTAKDVDPIEELTKAILKEVKIKMIEKPRLIQIIIYETSV